MRNRFLAVHTRTRLTAAWRMVRRPMALGALSLLLVAGCMAPKRVHEPGWLPPPPQAAAGGPVTLRVGLAERLPTQHLTATGDWRLSGSRSRPMAIDLAAGDPLTLTARDGQVEFTTPQGQGRSEHVVLSARDPEALLTWDDRLWRGELHVIVTPEAASALTVINVVELESYLAGVLPLEIGRGRPASALAALAAQAVAARTYAAGRMGAQRARGFDLYADTRDQVYGGASVEDSLTTQAVELTAGLVLWRGAQLADAFFHSTCGGHTAANHEVWPATADPLLCGVADRRPDGRPWCAASRYTAWQQQWSWSELETVLQRTLPVYLDHARQPSRAAWGADAFRPEEPGRDGRTPGPLLAISVLERTAEGRVAVLEIVTVAGRYRVRGDQTRRVLRPQAHGAQILRSAWFDLEVAPGRSITARGRGWGHGLGLCQMGALARAEAGQAAADILAHYYPGSRLAPLTVPALAVAGP